MHATKKQPLVNQDIPKADPSYLLTNVHITNKSVFHSPVSHDRVKAAELRSDEPEKVQDEVSLTQLQTDHPAVEYNYLIIVCEYYE